MHKYRLVIKNLWKNLESYCIHYKSLDTLSTKLKKINSMPFYYMKLMIFNTLQPILIDFLGNLSLVHCLNLMSTNVFAKQ